MTKTWMFLWECCCLKPLEKNRNWCEFLQLGCKPWLSWGQFLIFEIFLILLCTWLFLLLIQYLVPFLPGVMIFPKAHCVELCPALSLVIIIQHLQFIFKIYICNRPVMSQSNAMAQLVAKAINEKMKQKQVNQWAGHELEENNISRHWNL